VTDGNWLDKTLDTVKKASEAGKDLVQRNYHRATIKVDLASLRRSLDDVNRDIGRIAVDRLRERGTLAVEEVAHLLRRVDELEDQVAQKEKLLADIEAEEPESPVNPDETSPGTRRRPKFTG
jgi:hypothetical protein